MKKTSNEAVHLCPICVCVEMDFMERLKTDKHIRIRRFKCSVCDQVEMYLMGGPDDGERTYQNRQSAKETKWQDSRNNEFKSFPGIC